jgi:hypothetical protein
MVYLHQFLAAPLRSRKVVYSVAAIFVFAAIAAVILSAVYPEAVQARVPFYQQTLSPSSPTSQLSWRVWGYPVQEFRGAFRFPNWPLGYGTGTCSLGGQYLARILGVDSPAIGVESGYGSIVLEMGVPGLVLWVLWTTVLLRSAWRVVQHLRGNPLYPIAFSIFWFVLVLLFGTAAQSLTGYQNFVSNAYLWLLVGVLFRLPRMTLEPK